MKDNSAQEENLEKDFKETCETHTENNIDDIHETQPSAADEEPIEELKYQTGLEEKVLEYVQLAQRLQADFDNYRKRATEQAEISKLDGKIQAVTQFLPVLDGINSAKAMVTDEKLLEGFLMIENLILKAFNTLGVEKIEALNQPFDPNLHNALAVQNLADVENDIIVNVYQEGYKLNEKIIRYSQVIVNKKEE